MSVSTTRNKTTGTKTKRASKVRSEDTPAYLTNNLEYATGPFAAYVREDEDRILAEAAAIAKKRVTGLSFGGSPDKVKSLLVAMLGGKEHEVFGALYLDSQHYVVASEELFRGTIDGASVYPREVIKSALKVNAAAIVFYHNHPSGKPEPSLADKQITRRLVEALALIDIRVLDHVVCGGGTCVSFAERGLI